MDDRGNTYSFEILKEGDEWSTSTKMISGEVDDIDAEVEDDKTIMKEDGRCWEGYEPVPGKEPFEPGSCRKIENTEMKEEKAIEEVIEPGEEVQAEVLDAGEDDGSTEMDEMRKELAELRKEIAAYKESKRTEAKEEMAEFCEGLYDDGIITEGVYPKTTLKLVLEGILNASLDSPMMFSEGDKEVSVVDGLKNLLKSLPKQVEFNEATTRAIDTPIVNRVPKMFGNVDPEGAKEYNQIMKYMEDNKISNFTEARRKMYQQQG